MSTNTDHDWETFASDDPYWAVLTQDRFRKKVMDAGQRREFFASGEKYIDWVFSTIFNHVDPKFSSAKGLDFGCGVGRLTLPMSRRCRVVIGTDVSDTMLEEARKNCLIDKVENATFVKGEDNCAHLSGGFDFVNSFIVFQHIPCDRGIALFKRLIELLNEGGVGAVHVTYARLGFPVNAGNYNPFEQPPSNGRYHLGSLRRALVSRAVGIFRRKSLSPKTGPTPAPKPFMQMNSYLLNPLFQILQQAGIREMHLAFTDHGDAFGAVLFFKKGTGSYLLPALKD